MFFGKKKKQKKTNQENDMYELAEKLVPLGGGEAGSANQVYKAQTTEDMGTSGTNKGYAKKAPKVNQVRDSQRVTKRGDPTSSVQQQKNGQDSGHHAW